MYCGLRAGSPLFILCAEHSFDGTRFRLRMVCDFPILPLPDECGLFHPIRVNGRCMVLYQQQDDQLRDPCRAVGDLSGCAGRLVFHLFKRMAETFIYQYF